MHPQLAQRVIDTVSSSATAPGLPSPGGADRPATGNGPAAAAARELLEETGVTVCSP
ncbi:NUDIX domain-containing protein [Streptomyces brevispora]|uniref:NUDIX domain-containing protein n=1 Tax=Streptomyces brevispora TaxID=887462 RepID=UPI0033E4A938